MQSTFKYFIYEQFLNYSSYINIGVVLFSIKPLQFTTRQQKQQMCWMKMLIHSQTLGGTLLRAETPVSGVTTVNKTALSR